MAPGTTIIALVEQTPDSSTTLAPFHGLVFELGEDAEWTVCDPPNKPLPLSKENMEEVGLHKALEINLLCWHVIPP